MRLRNLIARGIGTWRTWNVRLRRVALYCSAPTPRARPICWRRSTTRYCSALFRGAPDQQVSRWQPWVPCRGGAGGLQRSRGGVTYQAAQEAHHGGWRGDWKAGRRGRNLAGCGRSCPPISAWPRDRPPFGGSIWIVCCLLRASVICWRSAGTVERWPNGTARYGRAVPIWRRHSMGR